MKCYKEKCEFYELCPQEDKKAECHLAYESTEEEKEQINFLEEKIKPMRYYVERLLLLNDLEELTFTVDILKSELDDYAYYKSMDLLLNRSKER